MDLVSTIRKEGSRGGQTEFKWSDVKDSSRRENYLGHSLMAPVGRWQQGRDLSWYTKGEDPDAAKKAREEEIRKIKEAEQEAIARALGLPVSVPSASSNANMEPLGGKEAEQTILEGAAGDKGVDRVKGVGFGSFSGNMPAGDNIKKLDPMGDVSGNYDQAKRANADSRTLGVEGMITAQTVVIGGDTVPVLETERLPGGGAPPHAHAVEAGGQGNIGVATGVAGHRMPLGILGMIGDTTVMIEDDEHV
ncbi:hypothetical protein MferCBS31731_001604 [Microsporum ferrugineum]